MVRPVSSLRAATSGTLAAALLGASALLGVVAAPAAARTAPRAAAPEAVGPLEVAIDQVTPGYIPRRGDVVVTGTVTNTDEQTWSDVNLYAFLGPQSGSGPAEPMTTQAELVEATRTAADEPIGTRIVQAGTEDKVGDLDPGQSASYRLVVPRSALRAEDGGVYWFGVHALGQDEDGTRDLVADGRARTFLPLVPPGTRGKVKTALVVPLRHYLEHDSDGTLAGVEQWRRTLDTGGFLRTRVDVGTAAGSVPITWVVDPALPDAVRDLAQGNQPRSIAPTDGGDGGEPSGSPSPGSTPSPDPSDTGSTSPGPDGADGEGDDGEDGAASAPAIDPETRAAAGAAQDWLDRLRAAITTDDEVLLLPFGDPDVPAAQRHDATLLEASRNRGSAVLAEWSTPTSPVLTSPSGYVDPATVAAAPTGTTVLLTDRMFPEGDAPGVGGLDGHRVAVLDEQAAQGGPGPGDPLGPVAVRQRLLAEAALRLLQPGRVPLVVQVPPAWRSAATGALFTGLDAPWLDLTTLNDATDRDGRQLVASDLDYPDKQRRAELGAAQFEAVEDLRAAGATLQSVLSRNDTVSSAVAAEALPAVSYAARARPRSARGDLVRATNDVAGVLGMVSIVAPRGVTLSGTSGGFSATVRNRLDQPVAVQVVGQGDGGVEVAASGVVELGPKARTTVPLEATAVEPGVHNLTLRLVDDAGEPLPSSDLLPIRSAQVSDVIWVIMGVGTGLLFLAILVRTVRRVREARRRPAAAS